MHYWTMAPRQQGLTAFFGGKKLPTARSLESGTHAKRRRSDLFQQGRVTSRFGTCPLCEAHLPFHVLMVHAEDCTGLAVERAEKQTVDPFKSEPQFPSVDDNKSSRFGTCPLCDARLPMHKLMAHAEECNGPTIKQNDPDVVDTGESQHSVANFHAREEVPTSCEASAVATLPPDVNMKHIRKSSESKDAPIPWWKQTKQGNTLIDNPISPTSEPLPGLYLFEGFITEEEEASILAELDGSCPEYRHEFLPWWKQAQSNGSNEGKRWGVHCNLRDRRVNAPQNPMPHFFDSIVLQKLKRVVSMTGCIPNEANAIDYRRKQGHWLQRHVDDRQLSKEPIANLSIAGDCYMTFRNEKVPGEEKRVLLRRRTLQVLTGKARYDYSHGICNEDLLSDRRVSITMRESPLTKNKS